MLSDEQIIHGCKKGKRKAFNMLYQKYSATMLGVCWRYSHTKAEAEDVLQEAFLKVFQKIDTFEGRGSFEGWIKRIMVNTAINYYKSNKKYHFQNDFDPDNKMTQIVADEAEEFEIDDSYNTNQLMSMINSLPSGYRMVFNMYVFEGMAHKEIASELEISENTSKSQLSKARRWLRQKIEEKQNKMVSI